MRAANTRPWDRDDTVRQTLVRGAPQAYRDLAVFPLVAPVSPPPQTATESRRTPRAA